MNLNAYISLYKANNYKTQKSTRNKFCEVFIRDLGTYEKYLANIGTTKNIQHNYIELSGSGFSKTRPLHQGIMTDITCQ